MSPRMGKTRVVGAKGKAMVGKGVVPEGDFRILGRGSGSWRQKQ